MASGFALNRSRQVPAEETPAFAGIAERFRRAGELERAVDLCRDGLKRFPRHLSARVTLGWSLLDLGRYDEARAELEKVLKRAPDNLAAIRGLAELHERAETTVVMPLEGALAGDEEAAGEPAPEVAAAPAATDKPPAKSVPQGAVAEPATDKPPAKSASQAAVAEPPVGSADVQPPAEAPAVASVADEAIAEPAAEAAAVPAIDDATATPAAESSVAAPAVVEETAAPAAEALPVAPAADASLAVPAAEEPAVEASAAASLTEPVPAQDAALAVEAPGMEPTEETAAVGDLSESLSSFEAAQEADTTEATVEAGEDSVLLSGEETDLSAFEEGAALALESLSGDEAESTVVLDPTTADESLLALDLAAAAAAVQDQPVAHEDAASAAPAPEPAAVPAPTEEPADASAHDPMLSDVAVDLTEVAALAPSEPVVDEELPAVPELSAFAVVDPVEQTEETPRESQPAETASAEPVVAGEQEGESEDDGADAFVLTPWESGFDAVDAAALAEGSEDEPGLDIEPDFANLTFDFERPVAPPVPPQLVMLERLLRRVEARRLAVSTEPIG